MEIPLFIVGFLIEFKLKLLNIYLTIEKQLYKNMLDIVK